MKEEFEAQGDRDAKVGALLGLSALSLILINGCGATADLLRNNTESPRGMGYALAFVFSNAFVVPLLVVALFQIRPKSRNLRSQVKIFCWASVVVMLSHCGSTVGRAARSADGQEVGAAASPRVRAERGVEVEETCSWRVNAHLSRSDSISAGLRAHVFPRLCATSSARRRASSRSGQQSLQ